jgi:hypothetical protein
LRRQKKRDWKKSLSGNGGPGAVPGGASTAKHLQRRRHGPTLGLSEDSLVELHLAESLPSGAPRKISYFREEEIFHYDKDGREKTLLDFSAAIGYYRY